MEGRGEVVEARGAEGGRVTIGNPILRIDNYLVSLLSDYHFF